MRQKRSQARALALLGGHDFDGFWGDFKVGTCGRSPLTYHGHLMQKHLPRPGAKPGQRPEMVLPLFVSCLVVVIAIARIALVRDQSDRGKVVNVTTTAC